MKKPIIGLALGSGAARGLAHIGVLKALDEYGIHVDVIAGSSAGALIGSIYCCGLKPDFIKKFGIQLERKFWVDLTVPRRGFIKGDRMEQIIQLLTASKSIEELERKLAIISTDVKSSKKVIFTEGPIYKAVRASISIPGIFVPVRQNDMVLVDGGVIDRVPVSVVKNMGADIILAVDVGFSGDTGRINHIFDVILQSIDVMGKKVSEKDMVYADVAIYPNLSHIKPSRFDQIEACANIGYEATVNKMNEIKMVIDSYKESRS